MPTDVLVVGVDAASPALVRRWIGESKLPALKSMGENGVSGLVNGVPGFFIGSTWPSFYTGLSPARHGVYRIEQLRSGTYDLYRPLDTQDGVAGTPFWRCASDAGRRVAVLDVPLSRAEPGLNGLQTVEWGGHDVVFGFHTVPAGLAKEVKAAVGTYPLPSSCDAERTEARDFEVFVSGLEDAIQRKTRMTLDLLKRKDWDLFVQVFTESHCAGHQCWHLHDLGHPAHDPAIRDQIGDPLERVYRAIDDAVAQLIEASGARHVLVLSAHGMYHFRGANFLFKEMLYRLGVTAPPEGYARGPTDRIAPAAAARSLWHRVPTKIRRAVRPTGARWLRADVSKSPCFPLPNGNPVSGIRLNLAGREPCGLLSAASADAFCTELEADLLAFVDERTGSPLVSSVTRTQALFAGDRLDHLPDLLVEWDPEVPLGTSRYADGRDATLRAYSEKTGLIEGTNGNGRTGEHVPTGMFFYRGPSTVATEAGPVSVMDFHPTLCRLLGIPVPDVDGEPIPAIVSRLD